MLLHLRPILPSWLLLLPPPPPPPLMMALTSRMSCLLALPPIPHFRPLRLPLLLPLLLGLLQLLLLPRLLSFL